MTPDDQDPTRDGPHRSADPNSRQPIPHRDRARSSRRSWANGSAGAGSYRILIEGRYDARPRS